MPPGPLWVMGAGSVGCWVGGCLQAAGADVTLIGRPLVLDALRAHGLALTSLDGQRIEVPAARLALADKPPSSATPALVLLTVKSAATHAAAAELARVLPARTLMLSLQNGIGNADAARAAAPALEVIAGMVPFNVAELGPGRYHRGTSGALAAADHAALHGWLPTFAAAGLPLELHADMRGVQWAKLLLNLNNPVNALSGLPLREELLIRGYRRVLAALQDEALAVLAAARIAPARLTPLPARALPAVLRLPTPLFRLAASTMLRIDGRARSSMADDGARPADRDRRALRRGGAAGAGAGPGGAAQRPHRDPRARPVGRAAALRRGEPATGAQPALTTRTAGRSGSGSASKRSKPQ